MPRNEPVNTLSRVNLPALIAHWARVVDALARSAATANRADASSEAPPPDDTVADDFRAEVDVRHAIAERLRARSTTAETREMLAELDAEFRAVTHASDRCLHGDDTAASNGWTPHREWYYWRTSRGARS